MHPDKSLSSVYSSQQPPTAFSFPRSTAPLYSLRKEQTSQRYQASLACQDPITVGINPYMKAGQDNPVERVQRAYKRVICPIPYVRSGTKPQAKQPLLACRGPATCQCRRHDGHAVSISVNSYEPCLLILWVTFSWCPSPV